MVSTKLILYTQSPQKLRMWNWLSRFILGPTMLTEPGKESLVAYNNQGEIISRYAGDYSESDLITYCLGIAALDLRQSKTHVTFSQYAGTL